MVEEALEAYREINTVLDDEVDLVKPLIRLEPIAVLKGRAGSWVAWRRRSMNRDLGFALPETMGRSHENESALGDFLADSLRSMCKADVAMLNPAACALT